MIPLPAASDAVVEDRKVRDYLLDTRHPENGGKAELFHAFGFQRDAWPAFQSALRRHAVDNGVVGTRVSRHGTKFQVSCHLQTPDGRNPCMTTVWIISGNAPPRLVTAYR